MITDKIFQMTSGGVYAGEASHSGACILKASFGTTGPKGGDSGHGAHLTISFESIAGADMAVSVDDGGRVPAQKFSLVFSGDDELSAAHKLIAFLNDGLRWAEEGV